MFSKELIDTYGENCLNRLYTTAIERSRIPEAYLDEYTLISAIGDEEAFVKLNSIKERVIEFTDGGYNLLISNPQVGTGKTAWACKIAKELILKRPYRGSNSRENTIFVYVPDLICLAHSQMNTYDYTAKEQYSKLIFAINNADLVIFDDIAQKSYTEYDRTLLSTIITDRLNRNKSCIFTTNAGLDKLPNMLDAALVSRITELSTVIELKDSKSHRKAETIKKDFFK